MNRIRIALIGYGSVGQAFARMLLRRQDYIEEPFEPEIDHTAYGVLSDLLRILTDYYA